MESGVAARLLQTFGDCGFPPLCPPLARLLYRKLGAKLVVGMPFKDIATSGARGWQGAGVIWCTE